MSTKTLYGLKLHSKAVGDHFFDPKASESLGTTAIKGVYRQPYGELSEGYVITVNTKSEHGNRGGAS